MTHPPIQPQTFRSLFRATITAASVTAVIVLASPAAGQSLNIDFGTGHGAPAPTFAAAGLAGVWNAIEAPISKKFPPPPIASRSPEQCITIPLLALERGCIINRHRGPSRPGRERWRPP